MFDIVGHGSTLCEQEMNPAFLNQMKERFYSLKQEYSVILIASSLEGASGVLRNRYRKSAFYPMAQTRTYARGRNTPIAETRPWQKHGCMLRANYRST
jgi:hypothetical protein